MIPKHRFRVAKASYYTYFSRDSCVSMAISGGCSWSGKHARRLDRGGWDPETAWRTRSRDVSLNRLLSLIFAL